MAIHKFQIGSPRKGREGLRLGTVRFLPRGVPAAEYAKRGLFDLWFPLLAPSHGLMKSLRSQEITDLRWKRFVARYKAEMKQTNSRQAIRLLAELSAKTSLSIGCYCSDESRCHRSLLHELIQQAARDRR